LKLELPSDVHYALRVSPGLTAGGGLKRTTALAVHPETLVSPGLTAGGGLKPLTYSFQ